MQEGNCWAWRGGGGGGGGNVPCIPHPWIRPCGGCHFGRDKTRDKVASRYFWHGQLDDVDYYIKTCEKCQKVYCWLQEG